jgi:hypothetical protein
MLIQFKFWDVNPTTLHTLNKTWLKNHLSFFNDTPQLIYPSIFLREENFCWIIFHVEIMLKVVLNTMTQQSHLLHHILLVLSFLSGWLCLVQFLLIICLDNQNMIWWIYDTRSETSWATYGTLCETRWSMFDISSGFLRDLGFLHK